jgi:hypothetical protein
MSTIVGAMLLFWPALFGVGFAGWQAWLSCLFFRLGLVFSTGPLWFLLESLILAQDERWRRA